MSKIYMGVDLGLFGSISLLNENKTIILCEKIPTIDVLVNKKIRKHYDINTLNELFKLWVSDYNIIKASMERLRPIPNQASQVAFSMGGCSMMFKTLFTIFNIPYLEIESRCWQKEIFSKLGIQYTGKTTKQASIQAAKQLFPGFNFKKTERSRIDDHNMADASLIAYFICKN